MAVPGGSRSRAVARESVTLVAETLTGRIIDLDGEIFRFETDEGERIVFTLLAASGVQPHHLDRARPSGPIRRAGAERRTRIALWILPDSPGWTGENGPTAEARNDPAIAGLEWLRRRRWSDMGRS